MSELVELSHLSPRTVRGYMLRGMIPRPEAGGALTKYSRETLGRLGVILQLREEGLSLAAIQKDFEEHDFESYAELLDPLEPEPASCRAPSLPALVPRAVPSPATPATPGSRAASDGIGERWVRVELVPGLDLMLREGASDLAQRLASEIGQKYRSA